MTSAAAVITAAGSSLRMQKKQKKQYLSIGGVPVLKKAVESFLSTGLFSWITITVPKTDIPFVREMFAGLLHSEPACSFSIVPGGESRQESVFLALQSLAEAGPEYVLIHDGVRPWIRGELINAVFENTKRHDACIPVVDIIDAIKKIDAKGFIEEHVDKQCTKGAQTPQGFIFSAIFTAHKSAFKNHTICPDDAEVYALTGKPVYTIPGDPSNRKITYAFDMGE